MNQARFLTWIFLLALVLSGCSDTREPEQPQKVPRIVYEVYPNDWYVKQEKLWKKEIEKNPQNAEAWYNYYNAVRYARYEETIETKSKKEKLAKIIEEMGKAIPNTYEYLLLKSWNACDIHDISVAQEAYKLRPDRPDTYYTFISHYEVYGKADKMREFCWKLYRSKDIAPWLLNYNYNVLMSTEKDAILITNGDNDTYPCWVLQQALGIRPDVTVVNISLSPTKDYLQNKLQKRGIRIDIPAIKQKLKSENTFDRGNFIREVCREINDSYPEVPIYFAFTVYPDFYKSIKDDLYVVGLAYRYSPERIDNLAYLKKNLEQHFRLDYLTNDWYNENALGKNIRQHMHMNYVVPMIMLAEHYHISGEAEAAEKWKTLALKVAEETGKKAEILEDLKKRGM